MVRDSSIQVFETPNEDLFVQDMVKEVLSNPDTKEFMDFLIDRFGYEVTFSLQELGQGNDNSPNDWKNVEMVRMLADLVKVRLAVAISDSEAIILAGLKGKKIPRNFNKGLAKRYRLLANPESQR
jgi:hypothetical protein